MVESERPTPEWHDKDDPRTHHVQPATGDTPQILGRLGKYTLTGELGRGGMGIVYEAEDSVLQRRVAIKILPDVRASNFDAQRRFLREARASARLHHPNVVSVFEVDEKDSRPFIVMELVGAGSLQDVLSRSGPLPWIEAVEATMDACRGLHAAHKSGLTHRDLKPSNLLLTPDGSIKLADFGLATGDDLATLTASSGERILGTPHFMSPEQAKSEPADALSDIYSLGATFYALLTGKPPYPSDSAMQVMFAHCSKPVPDPRTLVPSLPDACHDIVQRAMAKDRAQRFQTAEEFLNALERLAESADRAPTNLATAQLSMASPSSPAAEPTHQNFSPLSTTDLPNPRRSWVWGVLALLVVGSIVGVVALVVKNGDAPDSPQAKKFPPPKPSIDLTPFAMDQQGTVDSVALSDDGRWLSATTSRLPGHVRLWRLPEKKLILEFEEEKKGISLAVLTPSGDKLAYGTNQTAVEVVDVATKKTIPFSAGGNGNIVTMRFSPTEPVLAVGQKTWTEPPTGRIVVWNWKLNKLETELDKLPGLPVSFDFTPDGKTLVFARSDGFVGLWEWRRSRPRYWPAGFARPMCIDMSRDGSRLAVAGGTRFDPLKKSTHDKADLGAVSVWDTTTEKRQTWKHTPGAFFGIAFTWDNKKLITAGDDSFIRVWDTESRKLIDSSNRHPWGQIRDLVSTEDSRYLATAGYDGFVRVWDFSKLLQGK